MVSVVRFSRFGGPEVLQIEDVPLSPPGLGEAWVEQETIGVNYLDVMQRNGAVRVLLLSELGREVPDVSPPLAPG
ncbi:hypothetical protein [Pseudogulbenkiania sp. MAI-1]|uniref:hypothetical protein n=1 Tax=Pseudogulbenkiania sp. MAI-1 TaxID=990370 RepID=UPI00045EB5D3|nr:hypothetical protein [Pseudogulbenkiania sp. MAI-1]